MFNNNKTIIVNIKTRVVLRLVVNCDMLQLNPNYDVPCLERLTEWIKKNLPTDHANVLLERVNKCTEELKSSYCKNVNNNNLLHLLSF